MLGNGPDRSLNSPSHSNGYLSCHVVLSHAEDTISSMGSMMYSTPKRAHRGLHLDTFVLMPMSTRNQRHSSISRNSQQEATGSPDVLNKLLSMCKGILSRLTAIELTMGTTIITPRQWNVIRFAGRRLVCCA